MDFFQAQDAARSRTRTLVVLFGAAVIAIIASVYVIVHLMLGRGVEGGVDVELLLLVIVGTALIVAGGSTYRTVQLRQGGARVAEMLGGRRVRASTSDEAERRLVNVVEEMAIASGTPVPAIFVLDHEAGLNAFAAGYTLDDAAVAVTRGTLEQLNRDELQGVIAHEYSHILNGDMRLNIRLIGLLYGILLLAIVGRGLLYTDRGSRGRRNGGGNHAALVGLALFVVGYIGVFFGRLIQAAVSRQREYLADASAVQFTRNPGGIAGALTKIGAAGSIIRNHHAQEASHLFFASGLRSSFIGLLATHPPLAQRIRRIDPTFTGEFAEVAIADEPASFVMPDLPPGADPWTVPGRGGMAGLAEAATARSAAPRQAPAVARATARPAPSLTSGNALLASIGAPQPEHVAYASRLIAMLPAPVLDTAHDPDGAVALLFALLYHDHGPAMAIQHSVIEYYGGPSLTTRVTGLARALAPLGVAVRLPVLDLLLPALRELSPSQRERAHAAGELMIAADDRMDIFELALLHGLGRQLGLGERGQAAGGADGIQSITPLRHDVATVLAAVAWSGGVDAATAEGAFARGLAALPSLGDAGPLRPRAGVPPHEIDRALGMLRRAAPGVRRRVLEACGQAGAPDRVVDTEEAEQFRARGEAHDSPIPPHTG